MHEIIIEEIKKTFSNEFINISIGIKI